MNSGPNSGFQPKNDHRKEIANSIGTSAHILSCNNFSIAKLFWIHIFFYVLV